MLDLLRISREGLYCPGKSRERTVKQGTGGKGSMGIYKLKERSLNIILRYLT